MSGRREVVGAARKVGRGAGKARASRAARRATGGPWSGVVHHRAAGHHDPGSMSAEERLAEVGAILALGCRRLALRAAGGARVGSPEATAQESRQGHESAQFRDRRTRNARRGQDGDQGEKPAPGATRKPGKGLAGRPGSERPCDRLTAPVDANESTEAAR